jgi:hypothetical protein
MMATMSGDPATEFTRRLGSNEMFCHFCHNAGNLNVMTGLTLLTRTAIDEGKNDGYFGDCSKIGNLQYCPSTKRL